MDKKTQTEFNETIKSITIYHRWTFLEVDNKIAKCEDVIADQWNSLENDFLHNFSWMARPLIMNHRELELLKQVKHFIDDAKNINDMKSELCMMKNQLTKDIIERFPKHNSTNEFTNIKERLEAETDASFVKDGFSAGFLTEVIAAVDGLISALKKLD